MMNVCICGGGALGHVIAGYLSAYHKANVNILTNRPALWSHTLVVNTVDHKQLQGQIQTISADPKDLIPQADIVLLCVPGFLIQNTLHKIAPYINPQTYVGSVFSSTGFFFEAQQILPASVVLWGFQRVPFIARVEEYGHSANLLGYKSSLSIAVEHTNDIEKETFRQTIEHLFDRPTTLLNNYLEASLTNSNPILHTARLYSMFNNWTDSTYTLQPILFYEEWTEDAAQMLIDMDAEFFQLLSVLPVSPNYLPTLLDYYESTDAPSLCKKLRSIQGFKGILSPMKQDAKGHYVPDYTSRYFTEDFPYGLHYIWQLAKDYHIETPNMDKVYQWGMSKLQN